MQLLGSNEAGPPSNIGITSIWSSKSSSWPQAPAIRNWWAACNSMVVPLLAGTATTTSSALGCHCFCKSSAVNVRMCRCTGHNFQKICHLQGMVLRHSPGPRHHMARKPECFLGRDKPSLHRKSGCSHCWGSKDQTLSHRHCWEKQGMPQLCQENEDTDTLLGVRWSVMKCCSMLPLCAFCLYWCHRGSMARRKWCHLNVYTSHSNCHWLEGEDGGSIIGEISINYGILDFHILRQSNMGWDYLATEKGALELQTIDVRGDDVRDKPEWH